MAQLLLIRDFTEYRVHIAKKKRNNFVMQQQTETKEQLRAKLKNALGELTDVQDQNSTLHEVIRVLTGRIQQLERDAESFVNSFAS